MLIGEEPERPYERPALSKDYLRGEPAREKVYVHPDDFYERCDIDLRTATAVERVEADALLPAGSALRGRVGIANAQSAYGTYRAAFRGLRWQRLASLGATPQRPLWASTATKDPAYRDVMYLEALALPDTIVTVPEATLRAFADHGTADLDALRSVGSAAAEMAAADAAVDLDAITTDLENEGVDAFCRSYRELLDCIDSRVLELAAPVPHHSG